MPASFPTALATNLTLFTAVNNSRILLTADIDNVVTTIDVDDASALPNSGYLTFADSNEIIYYGSRTTTVLSSVTRGADGTAAAAHLAGVYLEQRWNADYHNQLATETIAIETNIKNRFGLNTDILVPTGIAFQITDGLGIGGAVNSKSMLTLTSTTKGFLPPRMTTTQRDAIAAPPEGLVIYNTTTHQYNIYNASAWKVCTFSGDIVNADIASGAAIAVNKLAALTVSRAVVTDGSGFVSAATTTATEIGYVNGVTSAIQTQLNAKEGTITTLSIAKGGTNSGTALSNNRVMQSSGSAIVEAAAITASRALISDANGIPTHSTVTSTELGYVSGVTSAIQTQINAISSSPPELNILDNGGFEIWQRGTSFTAPANNAYMADRWFVTTDEAANVTVTRESTTIDSVGLYSMKVVVASAGASKTWAAWQRIENYADYRGKTLTLSARVYSSVASAIKLELGDNAGHSASAYHSGGGGWETLTVSYTIGASATGIDVLIGMAQSAGDKKNGTYYFDSAMLVVGSSTPTFVGTNSQVDLARCQRFYYRVAGNIVDEYITVGQAIATTQAYAIMRHPVIMRATPTLTVVGGTNFTAAAANSTPITTTSLGSSNLSNQSFLFSANVAAGLVVGNASVIISHATTSYIELSADL